MNYSDLPNSCMAFKLSDGNIILISKEDVHNIAMKIIVEGSLQKNTVFIKEEDLNFKKADRLYNILKEEKDMKIELRNRYLRQIADLLSTSSKQLTDLSSGEQFIPDVCIEKT